MLRSFASEAFAAFANMRRETNKYIQSVDGEKRLPSTFLALIERLRAACRLARRWVQARQKSWLSAPATCLVLYAPSRTPKRSNENGVEFLRRVGRTNRENTLADVFDVCRPEDVLCIEVRPRLDFGQTTTDNPTVVDLVLSVLSVRQIACVLRHIARGVLERRNIREIVAVELIRIISSHLSERPIKLLLLTSNSTLVEFLRLAALPNRNAQVIEVRHGISSTGMESYFNFVEEQAKCALIYINLISGLPQFDSIRRHMLSDGAGEIAANCQLWSTIADGSTIVLSNEVMDKPPLVIIGGNSGDRNYFESRFFATEIKLISALRSLQPNEPIVYCLHPASARLESRIRTVANELKFKVADRSTLETLFAARAAFGIFSTSAFEAALIRKPVFLLPFDHSMLLPELLNLTYNCVSLDNLAADIVNFLEMWVAKRASFEDMRQTVRERLGLMLELQQ